MILIEFECRGHRFALPLSSVRRVVSSAEPTPLPGAPEIVLGVLNLEGEVAVVINFYQRIGLSFSTIDISQQLLVVDMAGFCIGLVVDRVFGIATRDLEIKPAIPGKLAAAGFVHTVLKLDDGLCVICDLEKFLFDDERLAIDHALKELHHVDH